MRKLRLKSISFEKQMTVVLPLFMVVLLLIGILIVNRLRVTTPTDAGEGKAGFDTIEQPLPITKPIKVVFILHDHKTAFFSLLDMQPTGAVTVAPLTNVGEIYKDKGAIVLREAVGATYYADITFENMRQILQYYGDGAAVTLEHAVHYTDEAGLSVSFPAGKLHLSSNQVSDLLHALADERDAANVVAALHADMFNRYMYTSRDATNMYGIFAEYADTDIRIYDFEKHLPLIQALAARTPAAEAVQY